MGCHVTSRCVPGQLLLNSVVAHVPEVFHGAAALLLVQRVQDGFDPPRVHGQGAP